MTSRPAELAPEQLYRVSLGTRNLWFNPLSLKKVITAGSDPPGRSSACGIHPVPPSPEKPGGVTHFCLVVTNQCNLSCEYCAYSIEEGGANRSMTRALAEEIIREINDAHGDVYTTLLGGEPLLNWDVVELVCRSVASHKVLYTNGVLLEDEKIRQLVDAHTSIIISADGPDFAHNRRRYRQPWLFQKTLDAMERLATLAVPFGIAVVFNQQWADRGWRGLLDMVDTFKPASFSVSRLYFNENVDMLREDGRLYAECLLALGGELADRGVYFESLDRYVRPLVTEEPRLFHCTAQCGRKTYFPDGAWHACQFDTFEFGKPGSMDAYDLMNPLRDERCQGCPAQGICGGGCPMSRRHITGGPPVSSHCEFMLHLLDRLLAQMGAGFDEGPIEPARLRERYYPRELGGNLNFPVGHFVRRS
jgi:uncharacterized protein